MNVNFDVCSYFVAFVQRRDLLALCLASRELHSLALPRLYSDVCVCTLPALITFRDTLKNGQLDVSRFVRSFAESVSRWRPNHPGVAQAEWKVYMESILDVLTALPALQRLALSASLDFFTKPDCIPRMAGVLSAMRGLKALWLTDVCYDALDLLDACAPLEVLGLTPSHSEWTGAARPPDKPTWKRRLGRAVRRHAPTLKQLDAEYGWHLPYVYPDLVFPRVRALLSHNGCRAAPELRAGFPALTHVKLAAFDAELAHIDKLWPALVHLDVEAWDRDLLSPDHRVRSLAFHALLPDRRDKAVAHVALLASPHTAALRMSWEWRADWVQVAVDVLTLFPGLQYLSMPSFLDPGEAELVRSLETLLPAVPAGVEVLELRFMIVPHDVANDCSLITQLAALARRYLPRLRVLGFEWMGVDAYDRNVDHWRCSDGRVQLLSRDGADEILEEFVYTNRWPAWPR